MNNDGTDEGEIGDDEAPTSWPHSESSIYKSKVPKKVNARKRAAQPIFVNQASVSSEHDGPSTSKQPKEIKLAQASSTQDGLTSESEGSTPANSDLCWDINDDQGSDLDPYGANEQLQVEKKQRTRKVATYPQRIYGRRKERPDSQESSSSDCERGENETQEEHQIRKSKDQHVVMELEHFTEEEKSEMFRLRICLRQFYASVADILHLLTVELDFTKTTTNITHRLNFLVDLMHNDTLLNSLTYNAQHPESDKVRQYFRSLFYKKFVLVNSIQIDETDMKYRLSQSGRKCTYHLSIYEHPLAAAIYRFMKDWLEVWCRALVDSLDMELIRNVHTDFRTERDNILTYLQQAYSIMPEEGVSQIPLPPDAPSSSTGLKSIVKQQGACAASKQKVTMSRYSERRSIKLFHTPNKPLQRLAKRN